MQALLRDFPGYVKMVGTSYCHYGYAYRKRTMFVSTLTNFDPVEACPLFPGKTRGKMCADVESGKNHTNTVGDCNTAEKNSLPPGLIDELIDSWRDRHKGTASKFLFIDLFSGWGSIVNRVADRKRIGDWKNVYVYSNDLNNKREHTPNVNFDMGARSYFDVGSVLGVAIRHLWPDLIYDLTSETEYKWLEKNKIAVLVHCSTPCLSYSLNGKAHHRPKGEQISKEARAHDEMNANLIDYFRREFLPAPTPV